jgi:DUF1680 family protein
MKFFVKLPLVLILSILVNCLIINNLIAQNTDYPIQAVPFVKVKVNDSFWTPRMETNRKVTIPFAFEQCEKTGRVNNFKMAAAKKGRFCTVYPFDDTDIYKTLEGAAYTLSQTPDKQLDKYLDSLILLIGAAQEKDGYLYTARTINPDSAWGWVGNQRWEKEREHSHELYNAGHLYEAAVAHYLATGKRSLLDIALKNADLICSVFQEGGLKVAPGHQVIEMGLVKLYRVTGNQKYLKQAQIFLDERGNHVYDKKSKDVFKNGEYWQDHLPVIQQDKATGHAVRAVYMYAAMADIAALSNNQAYLQAIDKIWENTVSKKTYLHGGIGAAGDGERFGADYELPNSTAYAETCASIGNVFWNQRMFMLHGDAKYVDMLERTLYNGLLSGYGLDGKSFFYTNAMQINQNHSHNDIERHRSGWFTCSCCPTNIARFIPSIPGYIYAQQKDDLFVNLFVGSETEVKMNKDYLVKIKQTTEYPWQGTVKIEVNPTKSTQFNLNIRIPGWARKQPIPSDLYLNMDTLTKPIVLKINNQAQKLVLKNGFAVLSRVWKKGDVVELILPMEVQRIVSNTHLKDNINKVALQYGPLVYCAEGIDNQTKTHNLILPEQTAWETKTIQLENLSKVIQIEGKAIAVQVDSEKNSVQTVPNQSFKAIPYFIWAHRGESEMNIWFPRKVTAVDLLTK